MGFHRRLTQAFFYVGPTAVLVAAAQITWTDSKAATGVTDWLNASDFPSIQAAVDSAAKAQRVLYIPAGVYTIPARLVLDTVAVTIIGAGRNATILQFQATNAPSYVLVQHSDQVFRDLQIVGTGSGST